MNEQEILRRAAKQNERFERYFEVVKDGGMVVATIAVCPFILAFYLITLPFWAIGKVLNLLTPRS